jgi:predicted secreted Zn-dependent protease
MIHNEKIQSESLRRPELSSRLCGILILCLFAGMWTCVPALAKPKVTVQITYYTVHGTSGRKLLEQLNRRGPKQGWWARSIAQTRYTTSWGAEWAYSNGYCRVESAPVHLTLTLEFPKLAGGASRELQRRWAQFMVEVKKHENHHAELARQMAAAMEKEALKTRIKGDKYCRRMESTLKRNVVAVMNAYEDRQYAFDEQEHKTGGHVDQMVAKLVGN